MTSREKLIEKLEKKFVKGEEYYDDTMWSCEGVADFIEKIVEPLLVMNSPEFPKTTNNGQLNTLWEASRETLKNAGVE